LEILKSLVDTDPENAVWSHELAKTHFRRAKSYESVGDNRSAEAAVNADREILAKLVSDHPDLPQLKSELDEVDERIASYAR